MLVFLGFPIFLYLDCGLVMCYGIQETTTKPDVLRNVSVYSLNNFAEVEPEKEPLRLRKSSLLSKHSGSALSRFIPPLKISPVPLAEAGSVTQSRQAN